MFKRWELWLSGVAGIVTLAGFFIGLRQYARAEKWKRTEFLAGEMRAFFADLEVRNALMMIDWAPRRINLYQVESRDPKQYPIVTRELQISALLPHTSLKPFDSDGETVTAEKSGKTSGRHAGCKTCFTQDEAKIRDTYDRFLDHLERIAAYAKLDLIGPAELDPHLGYWLKDIAEETVVVLDAAWTCSLLRYIETYGYSNVQALFLRNAQDIRTTGELYRKLIKIPGVSGVLEAAARVQTAARGEAGESLST